MPQRTSKRARIAFNPQDYHSAGLCSFTRNLCTAIAASQDLTPADVAKLPVSTVDLLASAATLQDIVDNKPSSAAPAYTKKEGLAFTALADEHIAIAGSIEGIVNLKAKGDFAKAEKILLDLGYTLHKSPAHVQKKAGVTSPAKGEALFTLPPHADDEQIVVCYSSDSGKTMSTPRNGHNGFVHYKGFKSASQLSFYYAIEKKPAKRAKTVIVVGSEDYTWSDPITCVIS